MESYLITPQEHSLLTKQVKKEPVKVVSNLLPDSSGISWENIRGLTWTLEEEL